MQESHIAAPEFSTFAELAAHYRTPVKHSFSNDILIRNGPLALISDRDYHYTDDRTSIFEIKENQAVIRQHMIRLKPPRGSTLKPAHQSRMTQVTYS